jgi:RecB family endonuclease NucS
MNVGEVKVTSSEGSQLDRYRTDTRAERRDVAVDGRLKAQEIGRTLKNKEGSHKWSECLIRG